MIQSAVSEDKAETQCIVCIFGRAEDTAKLALSFARSKQGFHLESENRTELGEIKDLESGGHCSAQKQIERISPHAQPHTTITCNRKVIHHRYFPEKKKKEI
jgi:hypothetical protein